MNSIVIGSGFGGIAAALRLKAKGHNVKIIEKHPDPVSYTHLRAHET